MTSGTTSKTESCVFFGSGPVAARSLELLLEHTEIEAVVTKPRPPHHRGAVPVLELAEKHGLKVLAASSKRELDELIDSVNFDSRYAILIDFGIIVSQRVIDKFPLGIINSHFSLLPLLRGADPITFSILEGHEKTGVSLMLLDEGMDTGQLIAQREYPLTGSETTPDLTDALINLSDSMLQEYMPQYLVGEIQPKPQPNPESATYSRKLTKDDGNIDWSEPAEVIERKIRAFKGWPQSRTKLGEVEVIITEAQVSPTETELSVKAGDGQYVAIDSLKPAGKKEMPARAFLAGYKNRI